MCVLTTFFMWSIIVNRVLLLVVGVFSSSEAPAMQTSK